MTWRDWYDTLDKPAWTPEPSTIGMVWQALYPVILLTFCFVFYRVARKQVPWHVAIPFILNLIANLIFTPIQFGMRNLQLACIDIAIVWVTILWAMKAIWPYHRWIAFLQIPYFIWVTIASVLQFSITWYNW